MTEVIIVGGGVGGLTLGLFLHARKIPFRVFEAAPEVKPVGVGINLLPHAMKDMAALGLEPALERAGIATRDATFFNRFGQLIYTEPLGRFAGYEHPQISIHRADLHAVLLEALVARAGGGCVQFGHRCVGVTQSYSGVEAHFVSHAAGQAMAVPGAIAVACDGIHSAIRKQLFPDEGEPRYSGVNMWRGVTRWPPILSGASMTRAGWLATGKMVIYPIRKADESGRQLINWVAEVETPEYRKRDWNRPGQISDFIPHFADWRFDWLDVPALLHASESVLEFPMVDQDPLPWWTKGRITLLGDAAHPMVPRGSNGAGQAILDAKALAQALEQNAADHPSALRAYEAERLKPTTDVVLANRANPPDAILREVYLRTGDRPFRDIDEVISRDEIAALSESYKRTAGYSRDALRG